MLFTIVDGTVYLLNDKLTKMREVELTATTVTIVGAETNTPATPFDLLSFVEAKTRLDITETVADTKNTTGALDKQTAKMYLIGAELQGASPQTYSNVKCYIGKDNELYSNDKIVVTDHAVVSIGGLPSIAAVVGCLITNEFSSGLYKAGINGSTDRHLVVYKKSETGFDITVITPIGKIHLYKGDLLGNIDDSKEIDLWEL